MSIDFPAKMTEQYPISGRIIRMPLESRSLKPLCQHSITTAIRFETSFGQREAKQRQATLIRSKARRTQSVRLPKGFESPSSFLVADIMTCLSEPKTTRLGTTLSWQFLPLNAELSQPFITQPSE
jgi:hypothetical protein